MIYSILRDSSTNLTIEWLEKYNAKWIRINESKYGEDLNLCFDLSNDVKWLNYKGELINSETIHSIWMRRYRGSSGFEFPQNVELNFILKFRNCIETERKSVRKLIDNFYFDNVKWLNHPKNVSLSKIDQLMMAKINGIRIPATIITTSKDELMRFHHQYGSIVIKPIESTGSFILDRKSYVPFTKIVTAEFIESLDSTFHPILCQEYIEKKIEIRSFYLSGKFYSSALLSQIQDSSKADSRNNDPNTIQRRVPYLLPNNLTRKLKKYMNALDLNSGSIDIIKSKQNEFVFLEVNPAGQFGMISDACNFNLERKIAKYLLC
ncbi:MAG: grasp-with-spasm system ATP-grasp peptide maturase [Bacteroidia bacterium]